MIKCKADCDSNHPCDEEDCDKRCADPWLDALSYRVSIAKSLKTWELELWLLHGRYFSGAGAVPPRRAGAQR